MYRLILVLPIFFGIYVVIHKVVVICRRVLEVIPLNGEEHFISPIFFVFIKSLLPLDGGIEVFFKGGGTDLHLVPGDYFTPHYSSS